MECIEEELDEDITAENVGYCELHPECCQTAELSRPIQRPKWWIRLLQSIFSDGRT